MKINLFKNVNGFGIRQSIVAILPAPCLEWTQRIIEIEGVQCIVNKGDCNQPLEFEGKVDTILKHPNVVGAFVVEMGCGSFNLDSFESIQLVRIDLSKIDINNFQEIFKNHLDVMKTSNADTREQVDAENILIGLKCGGSTQRSQETLNNFMGRCTDKLLDYGFRVVFNEPQESQGLEELYKRRTDDTSYARWKNFVDKIDPEKKYLNKGNTDGGIRDMYQKSLGALRKIGVKSNFEVIDLNENSKSQLFQILGTNQEPESMTQMTLHGAHCHIYVTGFGGIFGTAVSPTFSISMGNHNKSAFDFNYNHENENVDLFLEKFLEFLNGSSSCSERMKINLF